MARVLAADDAGFVRRWCSRILTDYGHEVIEASDGEEAVRLFKEMKPDAVLLDVLMPRKGGMAVLQEIRQLDPNARVAMLTTQGQLDIVVEARRLGARDFIVKPCDPARLLAALERLLA